jgi:hypothetical protein
MSRSGLPFWLAACFGLTLGAGCVPPRTLIIQSAPPPQQGITFGCDEIDKSAQNVANPPVENTCRTRVSESDPDAGVPDNQPNTRYVYAGQCTQIYEIRIFDPSSDHPRVIVRCVTGTGGP